MFIAVANRDIRRIFAALALLLGVTLLAQPASAAAPDVQGLDAVPPATAEVPVAAEPTEEASAEAAPAEEPPAYEYLGPDMIKGQPTAYEDDAWQSMNFQPQYTEDGQFALWMNTWILTPVVIGISIFVLGLLLYAVYRYRRREGVEPSRTTHNTLVEVIWTIVPVIILVVIAVPSITLLARQYQSPPEDAITIKATGYQWYWGYTYPDQGGFEVISNMLTEEEALTKGLPYQLAVDNRMVVPVGVPLRIQTIGADVIHSFAVPSLWFKLDAIPGRLNERMLTIEEPGIYYGQCSELCGARHAYMPIAVEAVPMERWREWVRSKGGTFEDEAAAPAETDAPAEGDAEAAPADAAEGSESTN